MYKLVIPTIKTLSVIIVLMKRLAAALWFTWKLNADCVFGLSVCFASQNFSGCLRGDGFKIW